MTEKEGARMLVRILQRAEASVIENGGSKEKFKQFIQSQPNYMPEIIAAAITVTQEDLIDEIKSRATLASYGLKKELKDEQQQQADSGTDKD